MDETFKNSIKSTQVIDIININRLDNTQFRINGTASITPMKQSILNSVSPSSREDMYNQLIKDDEKIKLLELEQSKKDSEFINILSAQELGYYMEGFVCMHMYCPLCKHKFYKYAPSNFPVIDLICSNAKEHIRNNECFLWQVKTSIYDNKYQQYFDLKNNYLTMTGSVKGNFVTELTTHHMLNDRQYQIGFICLSLNFTNDEHIFKINDKSFILIPIINHDSDLTTFSPQSYYSTIYTLRDKKILTWNSNFVHTTDVNGLFNNYTVNTQILYDGELHINPLDHSVRNLFN